MTASSSSSLHHETSESLFAMVCAGREEAFNVLYARHAPSLTSYAHVVLRDDDIAKDALQVTWTSALSSSHTFRGGNLDAWLFTILRNECHRIKRNASRFLAVEPQDANELADTTPGDALDRHDRELVRNAVQRLSEDDRVIVALRYDEDLSHADIAVALGITLEATKVRLFRARRRLADILKPLFEERHDP